MVTPSTSHHPSSSHNGKIGTHANDGDSWRSYGQGEPVIAVFLRRYHGSPMHMSAVHVGRDGALGERIDIPDHNALSTYLSTPLDTSEVHLRVILVKELSAEALQIMSTALGIHLGYWAWVASDQASDGSWLNTNNNGKVVGFDLPGFEFYRADTAPRPRVVREGRLKHLSSRHRLYESGLTSREYGVFINRRVSGYLIPTNGTHTFVFFSEDCQATSTFPMCPRHDTDPVSIQFFFDILKDADPSHRARFAEEPVGLIMAVITKLLRTWHSLTVAIQRDLENIDATLPESLPQELPEHNLYDIGSYLQRDIVQTLFRFIQQLNKFEGFLKYICNSTKPQFRPNHFMLDVELCNNNVTDLRKRLDVLKERGNMSLALINNYIALQQARQASQMTKIQIQDAQSSRRLSVVATIFLPLTFASSFLSTNGTTPIWVFVPIAAVSVVATTIVIGILKWQESQTGAGHNKRKQITHAVPHLAFNNSRAIEEGQLKTEDVYKKLDQQV